MGFRKNWCSNKDILRIFNLYQEQFSSILIKYSYLEKNKNDLRKKNFPKTCDFWASIWKIFLTLIMISLKMIKCYFISYFIPLNFLISPKRKINHFHLKNTTIITVYWSKIKIYKIIISFFSPSLLLLTNCDDKYYIFSSLVWRK